MIKNFTLYEGMPVEESVWDVLEISPNSEDIFQDEAIKDQSGIWVHWSNYSDLRRMSYPPIGDQMDSIYKGFVKLKLDGTDFYTDTDDWISNIDEIKNRYPKKEMNI